MFLTNKNLSSGGFQFPSSSRKILWGKQNSLVDWRVLIWSSCVSSWLLSGATKIAFEPGYFSTFTQQDHGVVPAVVWWWFQSYFIGFQKILDKMLENLKQGLAERGKRVLYLWRFFLKWKKKSNVLLICLLFIPAAYMSKEVKFHCLVTRISCSGLQSIFLK